MVQVIDATTRLEPHVLKVISQDELRQKRIEDERYRLAVKEKEFLAIAKEELYPAYGLDYYGSKDSVDINLAPGAYGIYRVDLRHLLDMMISGHPNRKRELGHIRLSDSKSIDDYAFISVNDSNLVDCIKRLAEHYEKLRKKEMEIQLSWSY